MNNFAYVKAGSTAAALDAVRGVRGAHYIAGGTNILDLMKDAVERPPVLVDINALPLATIERRDDGLYIGALARMRDVAEHAEVRSSFPLVAEALEQSASPQLRNMASMGGNVLQRTRCPYFRDPSTRCNKRVPGSGCDAIGGVNRREAVLGTSDACIATHPSDLAVALAAVEAELLVTGPAGDRRIAIDTFYKLPGRTPQIEHTLQAGELITGLRLPPLWFGSRSTYVKVRDRSQYEFALASAAVAVNLVKGSQGTTTIREARVALGGIATIPWRSRAAEAILAGASPTRATFERAADAALSGARGYGENDYKIPLAKRTLVVALESLTEVQA